VNSANKELKSFLKNNLYRHYKVSRMSLKSEKVINELFKVYTEHPETLPHNYQEAIDKQGILITVRDFIAGMTDRFALEEYRKLTDPMVRI
jgi:dGTPase